MYGEGEERETERERYFLRMIPAPTQYPDIALDISSGFAYTYTHTHIYIYIREFWHCIGHRFWNVLRHSTRHLFWRMFWHSIRHSMRHAFWQSAMQSIWHIFRHPFWRSTWHTFWNSSWQSSGQSFWHSSWRLHSFWLSFWPSISGILFWHSTFLLGIYSVEVAVARTCAVHNCKLHMCDKLLQRVRARPTLNGFIVWKAKHMPSFQTIPKMLWKQPA